MEEMEQQQTPEWISGFYNWYVDICMNVSLAMNNVSSSDVIVTPPSQTQPGLLATAVPHSIPAKPRKVCTLSPSLMTVNVVVCAYFICTFVM